MAHRAGILVAALIAALSGALAIAAAKAPTGRSLPINGIQMYFEEAGEGPPLVLLHSFGACIGIWEPHRARLASRYRLIIPDLRGHGRSTNPQQRFTHRQSALDVFALLDALDVQTFRAIGISSGGMTLLHMATQQPTRIEDLVLVGATTQFPAPARAIMERSVMELLSAAELEEWSRCSARGEAQTRELLREFHDMRNSYDDMNFTEPFLGTIAARTLIVHGDRDEFFPVPIAVSMYQSIPRAQLWVVPNGSHIPIFEARAAAFQEEALRFLGEGKPIGDWRARLER